MKCCMLVIILSIRMFVIPAVLPGIAPAEGVQAPSVRNLADPMVALRADMTAVDTREHPTRAYTESHAWEQCQEDMPVPLWRGPLDMLAQTLGTRCITPSGRCPLSEPAQVNTDCTCPNGLQGMVGGPAPSKQDDAKTKGGPAPSKQGDAKTKGGER